MTTIYLDNTHCKEKYINEILSKYKDHYNIKIKFFEIPLWWANIRNIVRRIQTGKWIPFLLCLVCSRIINKLNKEKYVQYLSGSDFHLGHANIAGPKTSKWKEGYRNFDSVVEMNDEIINTINKYVKHDDVLYFLGDFCFGDIGIRLIIVIGLLVELYMFVEEIMMVT